MTFLGMNHTGVKTLPWEDFYNLILVQAKMHDHTHTKTAKYEVHSADRIAGHGGRGSGSGSSGSTGGTTPGRGNGSSSASSSSEQLFAKVTSPFMVMKAVIKCTPEEWTKLTSIQIYQLRTAKGLPSLP
jgi:hypothetical protein